MDPAPWRSHTWTGPAADFHATDLPYQRAVWLCIPSTPALVLGSSQSIDVVDPDVARTLGVQTPRRRTGGGAVWVHPHDSIWIDVVIPRDDPLWVDDIGSSMLWLGRAWMEVLSPLVDGIDLEVRSAPYVAGRWGSMVCFAGSSPGEVFATGPTGDASSGGPRKLVGISQRRGRDGARFQCIAYRAWHPHEWAGLFADPGARTAVGELSVACTAASPAGALQSLVRVLDSGGLG